MSAFIGFVFGTRCNDKFTAYHQPQSPSRRPDPGYLALAFPDPHHLREAPYGVPALRQERRLKPYRTMQKRFAGMKPSCEVRKPMTQTIALLMVARIHPSQHRFPIRIAETMVSTQER